MNNPLNIALQIADEIQDNWQKIPILQRASMIDQISQLVNQARPYIDPNSRPAGFPLQQFLDEILPAVLFWAKNSSGHHLLNAAILLGKDLEQLSKALQQ